MKQQKTICDLCNKETIDNWSGILPANIDLCTRCVKMTMLQWTELKKKLKFKYLCGHCKGKGQVKEFYGPCNDYNWVECPKCKDWL